MSHVLPDTREVQSGVRMDKEARRMELRQCMETLRDHHTKLNDVDMFECISAITEGACDISVVSPVNLIAAERGLGRRSPKESLLKAIRMSEDALPAVIMVPIFGPESPSADRDAHIRKLRTTGTADGSGMHWSLVILIKQGDVGDELLFEFESEVASHSLHDDRYSQLLAGVAVDPVQGPVDADNNAYPHHQQESGKEVAVEELPRPVYTGYHYDSMMGTNATRAQNLRFLFDELFNPEGSHETHIVEMEYIIIQKEAWECGHMCLVFASMFMFNATGSVPWCFAPGHIDTGRNWKLSLPTNAHTRAWKNMTDSLYCGSGGAFVRGMRKLITERRHMIV